MDKSGLLAKANIIKNETRDYANDAQRIGGMFEDIINAIPDEAINEIGYVEDVVDYDIGSDKTTKPGLYRYIKEDDTGDWELITDSGYLFVCLENSIELKTNYKQYLFIGKGTYIRETGFINAVNEGVAAFAGIEWKPFSCFDLGVVNESDLDKCIASGNYSYQIGKGMAASIESGLLSVTTYNEFKSLTEEILHVYQTRIKSSSDGEKVLKRSGYMNIYSGSTHVYWGSWIATDADNETVYSWGGEIVNNPTILEMSTMQPGTIVLAEMDDGKKGFVYKSSGKYYANWAEDSGYSTYQDGPFNGSNTVLFKKTIYVAGSDIYICLNQKDLIKISQSGGGGSNVDAELTDSTSGLSPVLKNSAGKLYYEKGSGGSGGSNVDAELTDSIAGLSPVFKDSAGYLYSKQSVIEITEDMLGDMTIDEYLDTLTATGEYIYSVTNTSPIPTKIDYRLKVYYLYRGSGSQRIQHIKQIRESESAAWSRSGSINTSGVVTWEEWADASGSVLIGNITPITESSTKADIVSALLPSTFDELFTAIQNKNEISFTETGSDRTIISTYDYMQQTSTSKVIALEYIRGGIVYQKIIQKSNDDIYCSLSSAIVLNDIKPEGFMDVEIKFIEESTNKSAYPFNTPALVFRVNNYVEDGYLILYTKKRIRGTVKTKDSVNENRTVRTDKRKESRYVPRGLKRNALILKDKVGNGEFQTTSDQLLLKIGKEDVGKWIPIPDRMYTNIITSYTESIHKVYSMFGVNNSFDFNLETDLFDKSGAMHKNVAFRYVKLNMDYINGGNYAGSNGTYLEDPVIIQGGNMAYAKVIFNVPKEKTEYVISVQQR